MKAPAKISILAVAIAGCQVSKPVSSSMKEASAASAHRQVYNCINAEDAKNPLSLTIEASRQLGALSEAKSIWLDGIQAADLSPSDSVDGISVPEGSLLYNMPYWGDGDTDFFFAELPAQIASNAFDMSIVEKSDQIGHLVTTAYACSEVVNAPVLPVLADGSALTCQGDITGTGDNANIVTTFLSATKLGAATVTVSTEYGIDDPAPYTLEARSADNSKLLQKQAEGKVELYSDSAAIDFSNYNCFDLSQETTQSKEVYLCLPKTAAGTAVKDLKPLIIDDIISGDGYVEGVEGSCY